MPGHAATYGPAKDRLAASFAKPSDTFEARATERLAIAVDSHDSSKIPKTLRMIGASSSLLLAEHFVLKNASSFSFPTRSCEAASLLKCYASVTAYETHQ